MGIERLARVAALRLISDAQRDRQRSPSGHWRPASIGPSCSVADWTADRLTVWSGTQNPHNLRADLALLMDMPADAVTIHRMETAGCYGRNCADDVGTDAALLSRAVGRPVRVQLTRAQEHLWEPKGAAQLMDVDGGLDAAGNAVAYDFSTHYPTGRAPTLALILTGRIPATPVVSDTGDRTAIPPYDYPAMRVIVNDMPPIVRAAWLRGVSSLPNTFAHESYIDELAIAAGVDPVEYRLRYLAEARAIELLKATVAQAGWEPRTPARKRRDADGLLHGQSVAYALYVHSKFPGFGAAWSAWVVDVAIDPGTGEVTVSRVVAGQDTGLMINPDGVRHQLEGNVIQSISRVLKEEVTFSGAAVTDREWGAYPILTFPALPVLETVLMPRPDQPPVGAGESASVPSAAAIANAIFDATGVRFRQAPFTPERIKAGLTAAGLTEADVARALPYRPERPWGRAGGAAYMAGAVVDGWATHGLNGTGPSPLPWTESDVYDYLRTGFSSSHGAAAGPMAAVVTQLRGAPDDDVRAIAHYLASLAPPAAHPQSAQALETATAPRFPDCLGVRGRLRRLSPARPGAALLGVRPRLALNSNVYGATPDTLIRTILRGIETPALPGLGAMLGFASSLDDDQVAALVRYVRG